MENEEPDVVITQELLETPEAIVTLGAMACESLKYFGTAMFIIDPAGEARLMNHFHIYIDGAANHPPEAEPRFLRPIGMEPKPQYVAINPEDGTIWEVDYPDAVAEDNSG